MIGKIILNYQSSERTTQLQTHSKFFHALILLTIKYKYLNLIYISTGSTTQPVQVE